MPAPTAAGSIDALVAVDARLLDAAALKQHLAQLAAARSTLAAAEAAAIAEFDHRGCCVDDGMVNTRAWLAHHTGVPRAVAGGRVLLAKRLRRMPATAGALASGSVTEAHARAMARCLTPRTVAALERDEALLVTKAKELEADDFDLLVTRWMMLNAENGPDAGSVRASELHVSSMLAGRTRLDGELDFEDAAEFRAELDTIADEPWRHHHDSGGQEQDRSPAQRNAAALVEMARRSSAAGDRDCDESYDPTSGPVGRLPRRPQFVVVADLAAVAGVATGDAALEDGTPVPQPILQRWLCDSTIGRVVMAGASVPIDLGRSTYTVSAGQRRALIARDRGCIVPGCRRRPRWCDAHHVVPYPNGPTNLANLVLLCKRHHRHVHAGTIKLLPDDRVGWIVSRPDGTPLRQRPPPHLAA